MAPFLNFVLMAAIVSIIIYCALAILGTRSKLFASMAKVYANLNRTILKASAEFLWGNRPERQGIGYIADDTAQEEVTSRTLALSIREKRILISAGYHIAIISMSLLAIFGAAALHVQLLFDFGSGVLLVHALTFVRLPADLWLSQAVLHTQRCPVCSHRIPLSGVRWRCSCSAVTGPRSALSGCGHCSRQFDSLSCQNCQTTIPC